MDEKDIRLTEEFIEFDRRLLSTSKSCSVIPGSTPRIYGEHFSYGRSCHMAGLFQALVRLHTGTSDPAFNVLDFGCGPGIGVTFLEPFFNDRGSYVGIDVRAEDIEFCRQNYTRANMSFVHYDQNNAMYNPGAEAEKALNLPFEDDRFCFAIANSVFTHLNPEDYVFYLDELARVVKPSGFLFLTNFILDDDYTPPPPESTEVSRFNGRAINWVSFNTAFKEDARFWYDGRRPTNVSAVGIREDALTDLVQSRGLQLAKVYRGHWRNRDGFLYQDLAVMRV